ncbi:MAG: ribokinase [Chloroflexota bacterium]
MSTKQKVMIVGSYNTDLAVRTPHIPVGGETIMGSGFVIGPGGKGANQAVAAARLGADTSMLVKLGKDIFGDQAAANLVKEGVRSENLLRSTEEPTGAAFIIVDQNGENIIVVAGGANNSLSVDDVEKARPQIQQAKVLLLQLEVPLETVTRAVEIAHSAGVKVILNPAPGRNLDANLLAMVDVLTPNETEAQIITGMPVVSVQQAEAAGKKLISQGVGVVVITMGGKGSLVVSKDIVKHMPGYPVTVVDTTGAGDAFSGALAVALSEDLQLEDAVKFATAAAALQVTRFGTAPAMPYRQEVVDFLEK